MSDDTEIIIIGDPLPPEEVAELVVLSDEDIDDAIDWWNEVASDLYVGVLEQ